MSHNIKLKVNGVDHEAEVEPRTLLVHFLRDQLRLTGNVMEQGFGARGFLNATVSVRLEDRGAETLLHYVAENQIGGPIAAVGQRIVGAAAKMFVNQSFKSLEKQLEEWRSQA